MSNYNYNDKYSNSNSYSGGSYYDSNSSSYSYSSYSSSPPSFYNRRKQSRSRSRQEKQASVSGGSTKSADNSIAATNTNTVAVAGLVVSDQYYNHTITSNESNSKNLKKTNAFGKSNVKNNWGGNSFSSSYNYYNRNNNSGSRSQSNGISSIKNGDTSDYRITMRNNDPNLLHEQALLSPSITAANITNAGTTSSPATVNISVNGIGNAENDDNVSSMVSVRKRRGNNTFDVSESSNGIRNGRGYDNTVTSPSKSISKSNSSDTNTLASSIRLCTVVILWYVLGVLSISTTKIILRDYSSSSARSINELAVPITITPLGITLQQLLVGSFFLKLWTWVEQSTSQSKSHNRKQYELSLDEKYAQIRCRKRYFLFRPWSFLQSIASSTSTISSSPSPSAKSIYYLTLTSTFFTLGFLFTNYSFSTSDASFVETIKASEPITSASLAYLYKIESLSGGEVCSLLGICIGVLISTLGGGNHGNNRSSGNHGASHQHDNDYRNSVVSEHGSGTGTDSDIMESLVSSSIVMCSNLCFSFRGLYQKLYRSSFTSSPSTPSENNYNNMSSTSASPLSDYELQLRVHQIGVVILLIPFCTFEGSTFIKECLEMSIAIIAGSNGRSDNIGMITDDQRSENTQDSDNDGGGLVYYLALALLNAFAFTHYNLASSYVLSRISVVHHAALNCIRRLFAIVMTSIIFSVPITLTSTIGILVSIGGFTAFTYYKMQRKRRSSTIGRGGRNTMLPL